MSKTSKQKLLTKIISFFNNREKILKNIQARIISRESEETDFNLISIYHKLKKNSMKNRVVDDTTWCDLDMDSIFKKLNRTITPIGSQYLYHILHKYGNSTNLDQKIYERYKIFSNDKILKEDILIHLFKIKNDNAFYIPNLIFKDIPQKPKYSFLIYFLSFASLSLMISSFIIPQLFFSLILVFMINIFLNLFFNRRISDYFIDVSSLGDMIETGIKLSKINTSVIPQIEVLKEQKSFSRSLQKKLGWLTIDKFSLNDLSAIIIDYFNYFCLFNLVSFVRSINSINSNRISLEKIYEAIASLDAEISVASYLRSLPFYCEPEFNNRNKIEVIDILHPLLEDPVSNSFTINKKSCLITGSNMAGKTTFIKTLGVNIIIAQTLFFVHARSADFPQSIVKTSIKRSDDINSNKSYYYNEIEVILRLIELSKSSEMYIFLIDEIFKGTNTIERISASVNVLNFLSNKSLTFVTTHDIELHDLLNDHFEMYHFSEQVDNNKHYFDYHIKSGPCLTRNAIKLLELKGYPSSIVKGSNSLAKKLSD